MVLKFIWQGFFVFFVVQYHEKNMQRCWTGPEQPADTFHAPSRMKDFYYLTS